jgi:hypothetical protein
MKLFLSSLFISLLSGCHLTQAQPTSSAHGQTKEVTITIANNEDKIQGTIEYFAIEGGFFGLISASGEKYTLSGLPPEYRRHGLVVVLYGKKQPDIMTITQFGTLFQIANIEVVDDSQASAPVIKRVNKLKTL